MWLWAALFTKECTSVRVAETIVPPRKALGKGVVIEATADDGTIEAIHVPSAPALAFGVQWHAEWYVETTPLHNVLFKEFERACRQRVVARTRRAPPSIADLA
jgi:gamma-glutamyl-gamma-aminobutyrate hydrolase PuuD